MQLYDSANYAVQALAVGATVVLTAVPQGGAPVADKAVSGTATRFSISNPTLSSRGLDLNKLTSTVTLNAVVSTNALTIGGKTYTAGTDFAVGGNDTATAVNLAAAINAPVMEAQGPWVFNHENGNIEIRGSATAGNVTTTGDIEDSIDGVNWSNITTSPTWNPAAAASTVTKIAVSKLRPFIRVKPLTLSGTGARVQVFYAGAPAL